MHTLYSTNEIFKLIYTYSYLILFPLIVAEGPIVTIIAGFLASVGFLDPIPTYFVVVLGDLTGDVIYYSAGRWWLNGPFKKIIALFKVKPKQIEKIENLLRKHEGKVLFFGKLSHAIGGVILFAAGQAKISLKDFIWFNFLATLPKSLILLGVGYYFGSTISNFRKYLDFTVLGLFLLTAILIGIYFAITKASSEVVGGLEENGNNKS